LSPDRQPFATSLRHSIEMLMIEHQYSFAPEDSAVAARCIEIGMIQFVRHANARMSEQANLPAAVAHDTYLLRAMAAFYREPQRRWSVDELARASGLGRTAFNAHFRKIIGSAPIKTVNTIRLRQAAATLKQSKTSLSEIAFNSGFSSEAAFVRAFKRLFGTTPGRYRTEALATSPE
jgi:transcriptional regulator GlxA family with amidase domain